MKKENCEETGSQADEGNSEDAAEGKSPKKTRREPQLAHAYHIIRENRLWSADSFLSFIKRIGDSRLIALCMRQSASTIVERALHMEQAEARLSRSQQSLLDLLGTAASSKCGCECSGEWKRMALQLLQFQQIPPAEIASAVLRALETVASKGVNVFLHGVTSSVKSGILDHHDITHP
jgi:hypothetical protein